MTLKPKGQLMIIGGHEREGDLSMLEELVKISNQKSGKLLVVTVATQEPEAMAEEYIRLFRDLGAKKVEVVDIRERDDARSEAIEKKAREAAVIFFTGGDQLRITSQIGDSPFFQCMREQYVAGVTLAGTSAGAAAMSETMLISGEGDSTTEISAIGMAPGLGLIEGVVVDTHFAERGRIGRLIGVVTQNPRNLGLGIDEDTAILVKGDCFQVMGAGAVYVLDGSQVSYSGLSEKHPKGIMSVFGLTLHVLSKGDKFDLTQRQPI